VPESKTSKPSYYLMRVVEDDGVSETVRVKDINIDREIEMDFPRNLLSKSYIKN